MLLVLKGHPFKAGCLLRLSLLKFSARLMCLMFLEQTIARRTDEDRRARARECVKTASVKLK